MAPREGNPGLLTDMDRVKDYLLTGTYMADLYNRAALECTNPGVRELFLQMHGQEQHGQEVAFSFLTVREAYPVAFPSGERLEAERRRWREVAQALPRAEGRPGAGTETDAERATPGMTNGPGAPNQPEHPPTPGH